MKNSISTDRLRLRPFQNGDLPAFIAYRSDPLVARYQSWEAPYTPFRAELFLASVREKDPGAPGWHQLALEVADTGEMIGDVAYCLHPEAPPTGEIGFTLARDYQGQGYAFEAVTCLLDYLFTDLALGSVRANCDVRNSRSIRLLERLGMIQEGVDERTWFKSEWTSERWYAINRDTWSERIETSRATASSG
jgi:RimJ/RimL family protein N-acetyltransferase